MEKKEKEITLQKRRDLPHTKIIMKEMCKRVGADFQKIDFLKEGWYRQYQWSEEEQDDFKKWLIQYWKKTPKARQEILSFPNLIDNNILEKAASLFLLDFGWMLKPIPTNTKKEECK